MPRIAKKEVKKPIENKKPIEVEPSKKEAFPPGISEPKTEPKKQTLEPLGPGQKYFEAPNGTVMIGDASAGQLWYRAGHGGKGCWINPKR